MTIATLPADHHFVHVVGEVKVSVDGVTEVIGVNGLDAIDIYKSLLSYFDRYLTLDSLRVVVQYSPGLDGNEAGSRWFDVSVENPEPGYLPEEFAADNVLSFINDIDTGFAAGERFVA